MDGLAETERLFGIFIMIGASVYILVTFGGWWLYWRERRRVRRIFHDFTKTHKEEIRP